MRGFLKVRNGFIVNQENKPVFLRGVNLGGWLMMEGYILHGRNIPLQDFEKLFSSRLGEKALKGFHEAFRSSFIQEEDIARLSRLGINCLRVPFHYNIIENRPFQYKGAGLRYLDRLIQWVQKYRLRLILDLHAACGAQNHDWHSDSNGEALFWTRPQYRLRMIKLWGFIAERYKDKDCIVGYDLLNEAVVKDVELLNRYYADAMKAIRQYDKNHIILVEGNIWATDIKSLWRFEDDNYALSIHTYEPIDFTFNFVPHMKYPLPPPEAKGPAKEQRKGQTFWDKTIMKDYLESFARVARNRSLPVLVGEFGVNYRAGLWGETIWLKNMLSLFKQLNFHWMYWTYKAVKNSVFPDGLWSLYDNEPWVNRLGPHQGWELYHVCWLKYKSRIKTSWMTKNFRENELIVKVLKDGL